MWKKASSALLILLILTVVFSSGCVQQITKYLTSDECDKLEKTLKEKHGIKCDCFSTEFVPEKLKNKTGVKGKCYCKCVSNGKEYNISVVESKEKGVRVVK